MNELINIKNDEAVKIIGKAIKENKYDIAADLLLLLNALRAESGLKAYSLHDILFMNYGNLLPDVQEDDRKAVYVINFSDGSVKIGVSKNPKERVHTLSKQSGKRILAYWHSCLLSNSFEIERNLHSDFGEYRLEGEYFDVNYRDVLQTVKDKYQLDVSVSESIYKRHKEVSA